METLSPQAKRLGSIADFKKGEFHNKQFIFVLNHINQAPSFKSGRGVGVHYPPSVRLTLQDEIFDTEKKMKRTIRYIPGEMSIFMDEQTPDDKKPKKLYSLEFVNGEKYINGTDTLLVKYLMLTNKNGSNPDRDKTEKAFFLTVDPGQGLQTVIDQDEKMSEAQHFCYKGDWDEVAAYAMVLGLQMDRDPREIRYALREKARVDVDKFMKGLKSPSMKRKYFAMEALKMGIIEINKSQNAVYWKDGGAISQAPLGKDPIDDFVDLTFTPAGENVYSTLMGILRPESAEPKIKTQLNSELSEGAKKDIKAANTPVNPELTPFEVDDLTLLEMIEKAVDKGVVTKNFLWRKYRGDNYNSIDKLAAALKSNPTMWELFKEDLVK